MKYQNTQRAFVPTGSRESVPPYGVTRDYTDEEVAKSSEIRYAIERGYLEPYDPAKDQQTAVSVSSKAKLKPANKADYVLAQDNQGGTTVKTTPKNGGKPVEYIVADGQGVDGISDPDSKSEVVAQRVDGKRPVDHIESALSGRTADGQMKTHWQKASDAFEREIASESDDLEYNDEETLTEADGSDTPAPADADDEIENDLSSVITKAEGNMGARETNAREMLKETVAKALHEVDKATRPNYDEGEKFAEKAASPKHEEAYALLAEPFSVKKWAISKCGDKELLRVIVSITQSENVKALASQRLTELGE